MVVVKGVASCPRSLAPYIPANILKLFLSSSLNITIIVVGFSHAVSAFDSNLLFFMCSSSNTNSKSGLGDVIMDQN